MVNGQALAKCLNGIRVATGVLRTDNTYFTIQLQLQPSYKSLK